MKKPINKFALALWILAIVFVLGELWAAVFEFDTIDQLHGGTAYLVEGSIRRIIPSTIGAASIMTAFGVLIELVDQMRWTIVRAVEKS